MTKLMYIIASPRGERSHSVALANAFIKQYTQTHPDTEVLVRNLFEMDLPDFDGETINGKYNIIHSRPFTPVEKEKWSKVEAVIEDFKSADLYVFAVPMWNFNIPYRLKQFIDVITQPGYTVAVTDQGYKGMVNGKAVIAYARGGEYGPEGGYNFQQPYMTFWLGFIGITDVHSLAAQGMLGPNRDAAKAAAEIEAVELAKTM